METMILWEKLKHKIINTGKCMYFKMNGKPMRKNNNIIIFFPY